MDLSRSGQSSRSSGSGVSAGRSEIGAAGKEESGLFRFRLFEGRWRNTSPLPSVGSISSSSQLLQLLCTLGASSLETGLNCLLVFWERRPLGFTISLFNSTRRRNLGGRLFLSMGRHCTPLNRLEFLIPSLPHWSLAEISWKADNGQMITKAFCWLWMGDSLLWGLLEKIW